MAEGIWTMTESEFNDSLRNAYDNGFTDCNSEYRKQAADPSYPIMRNNPYEERKMSPAEIEEWRNTCPYPEALGNMAESEIAEANREHIAKFRDWKPGDPVE